MEGKIYAMVPNKVPKSGKNISENLGLTEKYLRVRK